MKKDLRAKNNNMLGGAVLVEWLLLKPCCVEMCGILFLMYGSSVFAITERNEMVLYDVPMFMCLFGFGIGMMFACVRDDIVIYLVICCTCW